MNHTSRHCSRAGQSFPLSLLICSSLSQTGQEDEGRKDRLPLAGSRQPNDLSQILRRLGSAGQAGHIKNKRTINKRRRAERARAGEEVFPSFFPRGAVHLSSRPTYCIPDVSSPLQKFGMLLPRWFGLFRHPPASPPPKTRPTGGISNCMATHWHFVWRWTDPEK